MITAVACISAGTMRAPKALFGNIGVSGAAVFASWHRVLSAVPYFEKFRWLSVRPEYDPFKYGSFPVNAGDLPYRQHQILKLLVHSPLLPFANERIAA